MSNLFKLIRPLFVRALVCVYISGSISTIYMYVYVTSQHIYFFLLRLSLSDLLACVLIYMICTYIYYKRVFSFSFGICIIEIR